VFIAYNLKSGACCDCYIIFIEKLESIVEYFFGHGERNPYNIGYPKVHTGNIILHRVNYMTCRDGFSIIITD